MRKPGKQRLIQARVAAGAAFLDVVQPGWDAKIDLTTLDITDGGHCVLGQLVGDYGNRDRAGLTRGELGFAYGLHHISDDLGHTDPRPLTREWKRLIVARRDAAAGTAA